MNNNCSSCIPSCKLPPCCVIVKPCQPKCPISPCCNAAPICGVNCPRPDPRCSPKPVVVSFKSPTAQCPMNPVGNECSGCIQCPVIRVNGPGPAKPCQGPPEMCTMSVIPMPPDCCPPACGGCGGWN